MKLSTVKSERKKLTCDFEDLGELNLVYIPGALTPEVEDEVVKALSEPGQGKFITQFLSELIESWDLLDDDDNPIPCTPEGLRPVPIPFLGNVLDKIKEDMNPGEAKSD